MTSVSKKIINEDGTKDTIVITSDDTKKVGAGKNVSLANYKLKRESKVSERFRSSVFGADIGFSSNGFSTIAILATVLVAATIFVLYLLWRI